MEPNREQKGTSCQLAKSLTSQPGSNWLLHWIEADLDESPCSFVAGAGGESARMGEREDRRGTHSPVRFRTSFRNTIFDAMRNRGWKEMEGETMDGWDIHWTDRDMMFEVFDTTHLESWQRVNHFR
jgi:hypothetical protein